MNWNNFIEMMLFNIKELDSIGNINQLESFCEEIFKLFQIDLLNYFEMKHIMYQKLRIQPSEIENMCYYEYEYTIENLKNWLEEEKKAKEKEESDANEKYNQKSLTRESDQMMRKHNISSNYNNSSIPKAPKLNVPKNW
jgi:hypothetical protein